MSTVAIKKVLHEVVIIALGRGANANELAALQGMAGPKGDYAPLIAGINSYMQSVAATQGTAATLKQIASNGLGLKLSDADAASIATGLNTGQYTWAYLFERVVNMSDAIYGQTLNNRADAAHSALDTLAAAGKSVFFDGASVAAAAANIIQSIGSSNTSLSNGLSGFDALIANLSSAGIKGFVVDGYVRGATVFVDSNNNGRFDAGEFTTTTDASGGFVLPANTAPGKLIATGGTDIMTNKAFLGILVAPAGATVVNPITTVIESMIASGRFENPAAAISAAQQTLNLPANINLLSYDPIAVLGSATATAAQKAVALSVQATALQVVNLITQAGTAIDAAGTATQMSAGLAVIQSLANALTTSATAAAGGTAVRVELGSASTLTTMIQNASTAVGTATTLTTALINQIAQITAAGNTAAAAATTITALAQVAVVSQGDATAAIAAAITAGGTLSAVISSFTGTALTTAVSAATVGEIAPGVVVATAAELAAAAAAAAAAATAAAAAAAAAAVVAAAAAATDAAAAAAAAAVVAAAAAVGAAAAAFTLTESGGVVTLTGSSTNAFVYTMGGAATRDGTGVTASSGSLASGVNFTGSGYSGAQTIVGTSGNNTITTGGGNDTITGGAGVDTITGGGGNDVFIIVGITAAGQYSGSDARFADLTTINGRLISDAQVGETYDGGLGNNILHVYGTADLNNVTLTNITQVVLYSDVTFSSAQMAALNTAGATITGDGASTMRMTGAAGTVNMSNITLQSIGQLDVAADLTAQIKQVGGGSIRSARCRPGRAP